MFSGVAGNLGRSLQAIIYKKRALHKPNYKKVRKKVQQKLKKKFKKSFKKCLKKKIKKSSERFQKKFKVVKICQVMSPHHSDQMSQRSKVSRVALCMSKVKVPWVIEWVSQWQGHL